MLNKLKDYISSSKLIRYLTVALVVLTAAMAINSVWDVLARLGWASPQTDTARTITISAEGKVTVTPDVARISFSVVTDGQTADEVQQKNSEAMNKVIGFVKSSGVADDDIKTVGYNLYPRYDYIEGRQVSAGYSLTQTLQVKIRDLKKVGDVLAGTVARGANQVTNIEYFVDDPDNFRAEARAKAFDKAEAKAKELTKLADVRLGKVVTFSESFNGTVPVFYEKAYAMGIGGGSAPDTEAGSQEITVNVNVVFEIK